MIEIFENSVLLDTDVFHHMMDGDYHMMDWWGIPFLGYWTILIWIAQLIFAFLIYKDAEKKENNSLLWFVLVIIPILGFLFLIGYVVISEEEHETQNAFEESKQILDKRYAKGEITRTEYLQILRDIKKMKK